MNGNRRRERNRLKQNSQCFFLLIATFFLVYLHLLGDLEVPGQDDSALILPLTAKPHVQSISRRPTTFTKPPLEEYVQEWNITKPVNWLMNFAIVGAVSSRQRIFLTKHRQIESMIVSYSCKFLLYPFMQPKTGTSTLMLFLKNHTESVFIFKKERCEMGWNQHVRLIGDLYKHWRPNHIMGIKCPADMYVSLALDNYKTYFPETKFIVGVRNPILWFESFYNFRIQNEFKMKPLQHHVGKCFAGNRNVCTNRAIFSNYLAQFEDTRHVFLYEMSQLENNEFTDTFLQDLQEFLGLETPLKGPMIHEKPGRAAISQKHQAELDSKKVNICDPQYAGVRDKIRKEASATADWILDEYLSKPNVKVSSPDYFRSKLFEWHSDPCDTERKQ